MGKDSDQRFAIDLKYKWDLSLLYESTNAWNKDFNNVKERINYYLIYKGRLNDNAKTLLEALKEKEEIDIIMQKLYSYALNKSDEDLRDDDSIELKNKIINLKKIYSEVKSFLFPEILSIDSSKLNEYFNNEKELEIYKHYIDNILRFKNHTLSAKEERIIASAKEILMTPYKTFTMLNSTNIRFEDILTEAQSIPLTKGNYSIYLSSQNRSIRRKAFKSLYKSYKSLKQTFAELFIGKIKANYFLSNNKKYNNPREMSLFISNIDESVYDNLILVTHQNLDKLHKYVGMKKEILGIEDFRFYDFFVDLIEEYDVDYSYEEAVDIILESLKPLGEDYIKNARKVFDERWIDVYESEGKRSGAKSTSGYKIPAYILVNYNGKLSDVKTIAHELGHSMHSYYSSNNQPYVYFKYSIFIAEIASNVNVMLLNMHMLNNAKDKKEKMSLINNFLDRVRAAVYRQVMFAEFEKKVYELEGSGKTLTEEVISNLYYDLNRKYYGNEIIHNKEIKYEWMKVLHFYLTFYVYQYATGLSIGYYIAKEIYNGNMEMRDKYLNMLSSGSSKYTLDLLKELGIDMNNTDVINDIFEAFDEQMDEFMRLMKDNKSD